MQHQKQREDGQVTEDNDDNKIIFDRHPKSGRYAVVEENDGTIWLYLTEDDVRPVADVWIRNSTRSAPTESKHSPPPAPPEITTQKASDPIDYETSEWRLDWSDDGDAALLFMDRVPIAFVCAESKYGWHRDLLKESPWGLPWNNEAFRLLFPDTPVS